MHLSEFRCLLHLELILPTFDPFVYDVLQKCPILQSLIIQNNQVCELSLTWALVWVCVVCLII